MSTTLERIDVHNQTFQRDACVKGRLGYETARSLFRDKRVRPKTAEVYLDMGLPRSSVVHEFLEQGNFNMMPKPDHDRLRPADDEGLPAEPDQAGRTGHPADRR